MWKDRLCRVSGRVNGGDDRDGHDRVNVNDHVNVYGHVYDRVCDGRGRDEQAVNRLSLSVFLYDRDRVCVLFLFLYGLFLCDCVAFETFGSFLVVGLLPMSGTHCGSENGSGFRMWTFSDFWVLIFTNVSLMYCSIFGNLRIENSLFFYWKFVNFF